MRGIEYAAKGLRPPEKEENPKTKSGFERKMNRLIGTIWTEEVKKTNIAAGLKKETAEIRFLLDAKGKLISVRTISKNVTPAYAAICENAVRQAAKDFPPVPPELLDAKSKTYEMPLTFTLY
jgi:hypothetical protein